MRLQCSHVSNRGFRRERGRGLRDRPLAEGSVGLFSQGQAYEDIRRLEQIGKSGDLAKVSRSERRSRTACRDS